MKKDTVESRALKIAAKVMNAANLCRYENAEMCKKLYFDEPCEECIRKWLLSKARKELKKEQEG